MKTRRMRYHEQEQIDGESHALISSDDYNQQEQIDEETADQKSQIDEECDDFISSDDYSEEVSSESDDAECDDAETDDAETDAEFTSQVDGKYVGIYACLNKLDFPLADTPQFVPTGNYHVSKIILDDEEETEGSEAEAECAKISKPTAESWILSWPLEEEAKTTESVWVNVHSYYGKGTGCGGYAVLLRNLSAQPIASTACFSLDGKSYFSQVLDGLIAGLRLASKHGCSKPYVCCNSKIVVSLLSQIASCSCSCESSRTKIGKICQKCANIVPYMSDTRFREFVPRIRKIYRRNLDYSKFNTVSKEMNEAARCLARETKRKALLNKKEVFQFGQKYRSRRVVDYKVDVKPREFSEKLLSILLDDAYDSIYYNLDERGKLVG
ncbi:hypothetical protein MKW94_029015 [Papaver nudicaule]|uniref:Uncharacterized protein n=1 Tax=Papaver nudicaule TaxID=74823 RepID=A0AA41VHJ7_PAPNU|nr:hypothetical protein [Papaver nudicaule]